MFQIGDKVRSYLGEEAVVIGVEEHPRAGQVCLLEGPNFPKGHRMASQGLTLVERPAKAPRKEVTP